MSNSKKIDRGRLSHSPDKILYDYWGRHILIAARKIKGESEYFVWSKGKDGISGTEDDMTSPYGEVVPMQISRDN